MMMIHLRSAIITMEINGEGGHPARVVMINRIRRRILDSECPKHPPPPLDSLSSQFDAQTQRREYSEALCEEFTKHSSVNDRYWWTVHRAGTGIYYEL